jgi:tRNA A37 threonylcarbamoyladenosine dehydratase
MNNSDSNWLERTELLLGNSALERLHKSHVLVVGLGGVGGYAAEQLCRAGIGRLTLADGDTVQPSNRNRQVIALASTEGLSKVEVMASRLKDINPGVQIEGINQFLQKDEITDLLKENYDYVVDAIDTLTPKVELIAQCVERELKIVSSMGAGGRLDVTKVKIDDISKSHHCRFASIVRKYLHRKGIYTGVKVVYSSELVNDRAVQPTNGENNKRSVVGTISYMPPVFGCYCSSVVINDLISPII